MAKPNYTGPIILVCIAGVLAVLLVIASVAEFLI